MGCAQGKSNESRQIPNNEIKKSNSNDAIRMKK